jgi:DNA-binding NtrC family response regulator
MGQTTVLIVDDEPEYREILQERLEGRGYAVTTAGSGMEALDELARAKYDAIVMDMMMPGMDGVQALKRIATEHPGMQVILLTGQATVRRGVEAMKSGALDFLEKPADLEELTALLEEAKTNREHYTETQREQAVKEAMQRYGW